MKHPAVKNLEDKWDRIVKAADPGCVICKKGSPFTGKESLAINGIPEWNPHQEFNKRVKEVIKAEK